MLAGFNSKGKSLLVTDNNGSRTLLSRADISVFCGDDVIAESKNSDIAVIQKEPMRIVDAMLLASKAAGIMRMNVFCAVILKLIVAIHFSFSNWILFLYSFQLELEYN